MKTGLILIVTAEVIEKQKRDGGSYCVQVMGFDSGRAFPQPMEQWVESRDKAHKAGKYEILSEDIVFKNGELQVDRFAVMKRGPIVDAKPAVKAA